MACIGYGFATNIVTPLQQSYGSIPVMARMLWVAAILLTPYGVYGLTRSSFAWESLAAMLASACSGPGSPTSSWVGWPGSVGPTRASFITYLIPVVALVLGVVFRDEIVSPVAIVGSLLVIVGAILASRRETTEAAPAVIDAPGIPRRYREDDAA